MSWWDTYLDVQQQRFGAPRRRTADHLRYWSIPRRPPLAPEDRAQGATCPCPWCVP